VAVPGHSIARAATRFGQTDAGLFCHVAAPGDGRTPAVGENCRCQNQFEMDDRDKWRLNFQREYESDTDCLSKEVVKVNQRTDRHEVCVRCISAIYESQR
jgi:hypothetical protein